MNPDNSVFVAGSQGLVGSAIVRNLEAKNYNKIYWVRKKNCDLRNRVQVDQYFDHSRPEYVIIAAAKVGGIHANNTYPADFIYKKYMEPQTILCDHHDLEPSPCVYFGIDTKNKFPSAYFLPYELALPNC